MEKLRVLLLATVIVAASGCASFDSSKGSIAPQPSVPSDVRSELAKKPLEYFPIKLNRVVLYDLKGLAEKTLELQDGETAHFTDQPVLENPSSEAVSDARAFMYALGTQLKENGFHLADTFCDSCVVANVDLAAGLQKHQEKEWFSVCPRVRLSYKGEPVLQTKDIWCAVSKPERIADQMMDTAAFVIKEMWHTWDVVYIQGPPVAQK